MCPPVLEKTQPLLAQEVNEEALQEKSAAFQGHFPVLDEEQLEEVAGGGGWLSCCRAPSPSSSTRTQAPQTQAPQAPRQAPVESDLYPPHAIDHPSFGQPGSPPKLADMVGTSVARPKQVISGIVGHIPGR